MTSNFAQALTLSLIPYVHVFPSAGLDPVFLRGDRVLRVLQDVHNVLPPASVTPQRNSHYFKIHCKGLLPWLILTLFSWIALTHCPVQSEILVPAVRCFDCKPIWLKSDLRVFPVCEVNSRTGQPHSGRNVGAPWKMINASFRVQRVPGVSLFA